jgi:ATP-dependent Clp protease ATP-binding subunit ClpA
LSFAAELVIKSLPPGGNPNAVTWNQLTDVLQSRGYQVPVALHATKFKVGRRKFYNVQAVFDSENTSDEPMKPAVITVKSSDPLSTKMPSVDGANKAKELQTAFKQANKNPDVKKEMKDPNSLFGILSNLVQVVARKARNSLVVYGGPGTGKCAVADETIRVRLRK